MDNNDEFVLLWTAIMKSLAESEAHSDLINSEGDKEKVGRKRQAESKKERKTNRVKRQCVSESSHKSHQNLSEKEKKRALMSKHLETLKELTPNCPQTDILRILDCVIEYMSQLQLQIFLIAVLQNSQ